MTINMDPRTKFAEAAIRNRQLHGGMLRRGGDGGARSWAEKWKTLIRPNQIHIKVYLKMKDRLKVPRQARVGSLELIRLFTGEIQDWLPC